jgi:hypothetical protein
LATERAKLSKLLARLPGVVNNHERREELDEEILATEEKIGLMADLLRPVRHGAAAKIEGLTDGETGLWIPRAYGILGKDASLTGFWKEWLKAIVVPMTGGAIQRVPASSPRVGIWAPLEKYGYHIPVAVCLGIVILTIVDMLLTSVRKHHHPYHPRLRLKWV